MNIYQSTYTGSEIDGAIEKAALLPPPNCN